MQDCHVCGRRFDSLAFQVVVPELGRGFDSVDCARGARALARRGPRIVTPPLVVPLERMGMPAASGGAATALRALAVPAATLGVLAAGTAAAAALWVRAVETETAHFPPRLAEAPPATAQETVRAHARPAPAAPESERGSVAAAASDHRAPDSVGAVLAARRGRAAPSRGPTGGQREHSSGGTAPAAPAAPEPAKTTGKDHVKRGKGHYKHGETDGVHTPGHGRHGGGHGHGRGKGR